MPTRKRYKRTTVYKPTKEKTFIIIGGLLPVAFISLCLSWGYSHTLAGVVLIVSIAAYLIHFQLGEYYDVEERIE